MARAQVKSFISISLYVGESGPLGADGLEEVDGHK